MFNKMVNNEITLKIKGTLENFYEILEKKQFEVIKKFSLNDTYYIPQNLELEKFSTREILAKAVLVREIIYNFPDKYVINRLTFKKKDIDLKGNINNQEITNCEVTNLEDAKKFMKSIGYQEIMNIKENDIVYEKDDFEIAVKDIENGDKLIEVEVNSKFDTIQKLKEKIEEIEIPVYLDDYFIKKVEIELDKILKKSLNKV